MMMTKQQISRNMNHMHRNNPPPDFHRLPSSNMASNSSTRPSAPTTFIRAPNPARDKLFRAITPSTTHLRTARGSIAMSCSQCFKDDKTNDIELRKCSRVSIQQRNSYLLFITSLQCKSVWYCSKEVRRL